MGDAITTLMKHLGIGKADVMGYSLGAALSLAFPSVIPAW